MTGPVIVPAAAATIVARLGLVVLIARLRLVAHIAGLRLSGGCAER
jgi:hypothetical protein